MSDVFELAVGDELVVLATSAARVRVIVVEGLDRPRQYVRDAVAHRDGVMRVQRKRIRDLEERLAASEEQAATQVDA